MAAQTQSSQVTLPPEIADKLTKSSVQLGQLGELLHVLRLDKQNELVRRLVKKHQDGTIGESEVEGSEMPASSSEDSERVQLGDNNYTIYTEQERAAATAPIAQPASQAAPVVASVGKSLLPYVLAAAIGGTGIGAGAMAIPALMKGAEKVQQVVDTDTDTNTQYTLEFGKPVKQDGK